MPNNFNITLLLLSFYFKSLYTLLYNVLVSPSIERKAKTVINTELIALLGLLEYSFKYNCFAYSNRFSAPA